MGIGVSTACFYSKMLTEQSVAFLASKGIQTIEVFLDTFFEYRNDFARELRNITEQYDAQIVSVHPMSQQFEPQLFSLSLRQKEEAWQTYEQILQSARVMGATKYVMHGPALLMGALKNANMQRIVPIIDSLAELALQYSVKLCWENVSWCLCNRPEFVSSLKEQSQSENLYFTLDIKQAARAQKSPFDFLNTMSDRLAHVHLSDYCSTIQEDGTLQFKTCLPGEGEFDFARLKTELNMVNFQGDCMLEVYSDTFSSKEQITQSYTYLKNIFE